MSINIVVVHDIAERKEDFYLWRVRPWNHLFCILKFVFQFLYVSPQFFVTRTYVCLQQNGCYCVISHIYDTRFRFFVCHLITEMFTTYNRWRCRCLCRTLHGMEVAWRPGGTDPVKIKILKTKFKALRETTFLHTSNDITLLVEFMIETLTLKCHW